jgi:hypothetical protein
MNDSNIIWKILVRQFNNDHPIISIYLSTSEHGQFKSKKGCIDKMVGFISEIVSPFIEDHIVRAMVIHFLDTKRNEYNKGLFKIKSIY